MTVEQDPDVLDFVLEGVGHGKVVEAGCGEVGLMGNQLLQLLLALAEVHGTVELPFPAWVLKITDEAAGAAAAVAVAVESGGSDCFLHWAVFGLEREYLPHCF